MPLPKFSSPDAPAAAALLALIASRIREIVQEDESCDAQDLLRENCSIGRIVRGSNHNVATLAGVVDALGYELVLNFRKKHKRPWAVLKKMDVAS